mmetsp:Transcript_18970/g.44572  ORF Transcript_18970/g.44572 Transcript_18970/m.44572 type:complete len:163 (-) Transcript_18970:149-637(-)
MATLRTFLLLFLGLACFPQTTVVAQDDAVIVETIQPGSGSPVTKDHRYKSMVTLYIEQPNANGDKEATSTKTPSGWPTRQSDGAAKDDPFTFQPGRNLIPGWTEGVLQMVEGQRAWLHVPARKGYGNRPMGSPGGAFYIPANSDLAFDIEILGKEDDEATEL